MLSVMLEESFDAAHHLPGVDGPCGQPHGHTYTVRVTVSRAGGETVGGMVVDFSELRQIVRTALTPYDHVDLNQQMEFPSAENIALKITATIDALLGPDLTVTALDLVEAHHGTVRVTPA